MNSDLSSELKSALKWIVNLLEKHDISYQISGGFAAYLYGSKRPVNDIDIDLPEEKMGLLLEEIKPYLIFGPARYKDEHWDLKLITLNYKGQEIDLGGAYQAKVFDQKTKCWTPIPVDLKTSKAMEIEGMKVPVVNLQALINYKSKLAREVDLMDIASLSG